MGAGLGPDPTRRAVRPPGEFDMAKTGTSGDIEADPGGPLAGGEDRAIAEHQHLGARGGIGGARGGIGGARGGIGGARGGIGPGRKFGGDFGSDPARVAEQQADARFRHVLFSPGIALFCPSASSRTTVRDNEARPRPGHAPAPRTNVGI